MDLNHIALNEIPPQGASYKVTDEALWVRRLGEFGVSCRIVEPVEAEVLVLPQEDGCLLRGSIRGVVAMPCNRCMEETLVATWWTWRAQSPARLPTWKPSAV